MSEKSSLLQSARGRDASFRVHLWHVLPIAIALLLILFPFDWLSEAWPVFGDLFEQVFRTARDHAIGHATLFFIASLLILQALPFLRTRVVLYGVCMVLAAIGEEALQALFKLHLPNFGDGRDIFFDLVGIVLALLVSLLWQRLISTRRMGTIQEGVLGNASPPAGAAGRPRPIFPARRRRPQRVK